MSKINNPILFSSYVNISTKILFNKGLINPLLLIDFYERSHKIILSKIHSINRFNSCLENIVKLLISSQE